MKGRKPLPAHIRLLEGNPGHREINQDEPRPKPIIPEPLELLDQRAKRLYEIIGSQLLHLKVVTEIDGAGLSILSQLISDLIRYERQIRREGTVTRICALTKEGKKVQIGMKANPKIIMRRETIKLIRSFLSEFGMTPSSRTRLKVSPELDDEEFEALLTRVK